MKKNLECDRFLLDTVLLDVNHDLFQFQSDLKVALDSLRDIECLIAEFPDATSPALLLLNRRKITEQDRINELQDLILKREFMARVIRFYISHIKKEG